MRLTLVLTLLVAGCAASPPPVLRAREERPDPYAGVWDPDVAPIATTLPLPPGWTAQRALDALAERRIDAQVGDAGLRLEAPRHTIAIARAILEDRARFAGVPLELSGVMQTLPVEALPRLERAWPEAPGVVALVVGAEAWAELRERWLVNFVRRRWDGRSTTVVDDAPGTLEWKTWRWHDALRVRVARAGDGDLAIVDVTRQVLAATLDPEPVLWHEGADEPTLPLSRTTFQQARVTRRVARDEVLVLLQRVSADTAAITALAWRPAGR